jgi:hypothetical protein
MRTSPLWTMLALCANGCVLGLPVSDRAICDGTRVERADHAAALAAEGTPRVLATGVRLIGRLDAGCAG